MRIPALGSSRTSSTSLRAGRVMAPSWSTEAGTVVPTAMSRSVPESRSPSLVASSRMLPSPGNVALLAPARWTGWTPPAGGGRPPARCLCWHRGVDRVDAFGQLLASDGELHRGHPGVAKEAVTLSVQVYRRSSRGWANVGPSGKTLLRRALHQGCRV